MSGNILLPFLATETDAQLASMENKLWVRITEPAQQHVFR